MLEGRLSAITSAPQRKRNLAGRSTSLDSTSMHCGIAAAVASGWPESAPAGHYRINLEAGQANKDSLDLPWSLILVEPHRAY